MCTAQEGEGQKAPKLRACGVASSSRWVRLAQWPPAFACGTLTLPCAAPCRALLCCAAYPLQIMLCPDPLTGQTFTKLVDFGLHKVIDDRIKKVHSWEQCWEQCWGRCWEWCWAGTCRVPGKAPPPR